MVKVDIVEIELSSLCNAKCSACMRTMLDTMNKPYHKGNLTFDQIQEWFDPMNLKNTKIKMCGVLGDPMINPDLKEILFYFLYEKNVRDIEMSTNGGTRTKEFWKELGLLSKNSNKRFYIHWAIDGATRNDYRENVDLNRVWQNVDAYHSTGGHSIWQYIIFGYNEHEVDEAIEIAKQEDFSLLLINTNRGFNPDSPLLRKNVKFKLTSPDKKHLQERVKKEYWGHKTQSLETWHKLPRKKMEAMKELS